MSNASSPGFAARMTVMTLMTSAVDTCDEMIEPLKEGEKIWMEQIVTVLAAKHNLKPEKVYPFVSTYINSRTDLSVVRGKHGGVYKGIRQVDPKVAERLLKRAQKAEAEAASATQRANDLRAKVALSSGQA